MNRNLVIGSLFLLVTSVFSTESKAQNSGKNQIGDVLVGMASYYPDNEEKRKTVGGDIYDMTAMEAAHKTFPMGSLIKVTNLETGKEVMLRVNDKPATNERIMDMTLAAADSLGMVKEQKAVIPVRTEIVALGVARSANLRQILATAPSPSKKEDKNIAKTQEKETPKETPKEQAKRIAAEKLAKEKAEKAEKLAKAQKEKAEKLAKAQKEKAEKAEKLAATQKEKADKIKAEKDKNADKNADKNSTKIIAAAPKTEVKTETKVETKPKVEADKKSTLFKEIAVYDITGKKQKPQGFGIQTGNFTEENRAIDEAKTIEALKIGTVYVQTATSSDGKKTYAVLVGDFKAKEETKDVIKQLVEKKYSPFAKKY